MSRQFFPAQQQEPTSAPSASSSVGRDFTQIPAHATTRSNEDFRNAHEEEADSTAQQIVSEQATPFAVDRSASPRFVSSTSRNLHGETVPAVAHDVLRSSGQHLDAEARGFMESQFGHDFSRVRVHTDMRAAESARSLRARAYTVGSSLVFGPGQYAPHSTEGRRLLAHELTHIVQQQSSGVLGLQCDPDDKSATKNLGPPGEGKYTLREYEEWLKYFGKSVGTYTPKTKHESSKGKFVYRVISWERSRRDDSLHEVWFTAENGNTWMLAVQVDGSFVDSSGLLWKRQTSG